MKLVSKLFIVMGLVCLVSSCGNSPESKKSPFSIKISDAKKSYTTGAAISTTIVNKENFEIDSVVYFLAEKRLQSATSASAVQLPLTDKKVGSRTLSAEIYAEGNAYTTQTSITIVPKTAPKVYTYEIVERFPHDQNAFTQGLEFHGELLYEGTGQKGRSSLRKTNYTTGEVLEKVDLSNEYFGEGITILNDKIYQLTWQENTGFIYDLKSMEKTGTFVYNKSKEGWGLCNDGKTIYKSDGTEKIWTLNSNTLAEEDYIQIYTNKQKIKRVNELEWVDGKIYANIWERNSIAIVDPESGAVEGVINLSGLQKEVTQHPQLDVLNGIAYKGEPNMLYVTGKNWDTLFKIKVVEK